MLVKHLKNVKKIAENQPKITAMLYKRDETKDQVGRAEIKIAALFAEYNLPMRFCDH